VIILGKDYIVFDDENEKDEKENKTILSSGTYKFSSGIKEKKKKKEKGVFIFED